MKKYFDIIFLIISPKKRKLMSPEQREIALYIIFGAATTAVSFFSYFIFRLIFPDEESVFGFLRWVFRLTECFGIENKTALPVILSWILAVTFAYFTNKKWVFKSCSRGFGAVKEAVLFYAARLLTLFVDLLIMYLLVDLTRISSVWYEAMARIFVSVIILILNYIFSRFFIFKSN